MPPGGPRWHQGAVLGRHAARGAVSDCRQSTEILARRAAQLRPAQRPCRAGEATTRFETRVETHETRARLEAPGSSRSQRHGSPRRARPVSRRSRAPSAAGQGARRGASKHGARICSASARSASPPSGELHHVGSLRHPASLILERCRKMGISGAMFCTSVASCLGASTVADFTRKHLPLGVDGELLVPSDGDEDRHTTFDEISTLPTAAATRAPRSAADMWARRADSFRSSKGRAACVMLSWLQGGPLTGRWMAWGGSW